MTTETTVPPNAFLVRVKVGQWSSRKLDRKATKEARERAGASDRAGVAVHKRLLASDALDAIASIANAAQAEHRRRTVPWQYEGPGAITSQGYSGYLEAMRRFETEFNIAVKTFLAAYDTERQGAPAILGALYDPTDYPPVAEVASKFSFRVIVEPLPKSDDFRAVGLTAEQTAEVKQSLDTGLSEMLAAAQATAWERITERVVKMLEKLRAYKPATEDKKAQGIFRDSLVGNIQELIDVMPSLNITNDPALTAITTRLQSDLCALTADELREDEAARNEVAKKAQAILQEVWAKRRAARSEVQAA